MLAYFYFLTAFFSRSLRLIRFIIIFLTSFVLLSSAWAEPIKSTPFKKALPGYNYQFPRDDFSHDDFRIEWWYYTGNLYDKENRSFGYQLTFFRVALDQERIIRNTSAWKINHIYFAHMTLSNIHDETFHFFERINRKGIKNAGADSNQLHVWNENWELASEKNTHHLKALESGVGLDLRLTPVKKRVLHGKNGISKKGNNFGNASHYFSFTRMKTTGQIFLKDKTLSVGGTSWMDHEFSSDQLNENLVGWDWFSIKLDNNTELMLYQLRKKDGGKEAHSSGTRVLSNGESHHISNSEFSITVNKTWISPHTQAIYPADWTLNLPGGTLKVSPDFPDQELYDLRSISGSYWEGSVSIKGELQGKSVKGKGYVELVGYEKDLKQDLPNK